MSRRLKIRDWLVHGGHQYEFFKSNHSFYCSLPNGAAPSVSDFGRPRLERLNYVTAKKADRELFDIIMVRSGVHPEAYRRLRYNKLKRPACIAVVQTHTPFSIPVWAKHVVWNSKVVMDEYKDSFKGKKHYYIPHGFDSNEFRFFSLDRNDRMLSVVNVFEKRKALLGFDNWRWVSSRVKKSDLLGHGNDSLKESIGSCELEGLVQKYNEYGVFLNTTTRSAMPRSRAEALMCGMPVVTTKNYGIERYLEDKRDCLFADTKEDMLKCVKKVLSSKSMQEDLGSAARETAIKHFGLKEYLDKWNGVFEDALRRR